MVCLSWLAGWLHGFQSQTWGFEDAVEGGREVQGRAACPGCGTSGVPLPGGGWAVRRHP